MPLKTLCGIFDEPKKTSKKNFIRENIKALKHLEGIVQQAQRVEQNKLSNKGNSKLTRDKIKSCSLGDLQVSSKEDTLSRTKDQNINAKPVYKTLSAIDKMKNVSKSKGFKPNKIVLEKNGKPQYSNRSVQTDFDIPAIDINSPTITPDVPPIVKDVENSTVTPTVPFIVKEVALEPQYPPGHMILSEKERVETLATYRKNYDRLINDLNSLPLTCDTLRIRKKQMEIESELRKIEDAIKIFDRPRVFIKK